MDLSDIDLVNPDRWVKGVPHEERRLLLFDLLISLFERAYLLVYEDDMSRKQARMWQSWEDYMHFWCQREDFRALLPEMLEGEDPDFSRHLLRIATTVQQAGA